MGFLLFKTKKNFFDILGLKVNSALEKKLTEVKFESRFTDYSVPISDNFGLFDIATFRIFGGKKDISGQTDFNLILGSINSRTTINKIQNFIDTITKEYGNNRMGNGKWQESEVDSLINYWDGREWILDLKGNNYTQFQDNCFQVNFSFDMKDGICLAIIGAHQIVKK